MTDPINGVGKTNYSVVDFLGWQRQGELDLRPWYQRRSVWNPRLKSLLIDSLLRGFPLPLIFLKSSLDVDTARSVRQVIDGQQRLRTILSYIDPDSLPDFTQEDDFSILPSHNREFAGLTFSELPGDMKQMLLNAPLSVNVLPPDVKDVTVLQMFQRMNSTGLKLTPQEIRNATFSGEFKELSYQLAYEQYHRWSGWGLISGQAIAQMKEVEFTSDLLGLLMRGVSAGSSSAITRLYKEHEEDLPGKDWLADTFRDACDTLDEIYGERAGPRTQLRRFRTLPWAYAVFALVTAADAVDVRDEPQGDGTSMAPVQGRQLRGALMQAEETIASGKGLDDELAMTLRGATGDRAGRQARISFLRKHL